MKHWNGILRQPSTDSHMIDCPYAIAAVEPVSTMQPPVLAAMAVYIGKTRLIDKSSFTKAEDIKTV